MREEPSLVERTHPSYERVESGPVQINGIVVSRDIE